MMRSDIDERCKGLVRFYMLLDMLERKIGGARKLVACTGRMDWPKRGVYFFREVGEARSDTGSGPRIVRVGTHAVRMGSRTKLWTRLSQHKGQFSTGGGNHRGSVFRCRVGKALTNRDNLDFPVWGNGKTATKEVRNSELDLERQVTAVIGEMPFLWLPLDDEAGPRSLRWSIECNSIALLSNYGRPVLDPPSPVWLGRYCDKEEVRKSGLWNSDCVDETYDPSFLDVLEQLLSNLGTS